MGIQLAKIHKKSVENTPVSQSAKKDRRVFWMLCSKLEQVWVQACLYMLYNMHMIVSRNNFRISASPGNIHASQWHQMGRLVSGGSHQNEGGRPDSDR